jgi:hypothetical protein
MRNADRRKSWGLKGVISFSIFPRLRRRIHQTRAITTTASAITPATIPPTMGPVLESSPPSLLERVVELGVAVEDWPKKLVRTAVSLSTSVTTTREVEVVGVEVVVGVWAWVEVVVGVVDVVLDEVVDEVEEVVEIS